MMKVTKQQAALINMSGDDIFKPKRNTLLRTIQMACSPFFQG